MKSFEKKAAWVIFQLVFAAVFIVLAIVLSHSELKDTSWVSLCGGLGGFAFILSIFNVVNIWEGLEKKNQATKLFNDNSKFEFGMTSEFIAHVQSMLELLKDMPDERLALINCIGQIVKKSRLESLILYCVDEKPDMLDQKELSRLQLHYVGCFPEKPEKAFEGISEFDRDDEKTMNNLTRLIKRYFKLTGPYGSAIDLGGGIFRYLGSKGLSAGSLAIFAQKLDSALIEKGDFSREKSAEILREVLRLNNA